MNPTTYPPAPIWRRLAALVYDSFILVALSFLYGGIVTTLATFGGHEAADYQPMFSGILFPLGWLLTLSGFYCFFWRRSGQTIGMKTWHIKVVQAKNEGATPDWQQCCARAVIAVPMVLLFGVGYVYGALHTSKQTLQDKFSGTKVIFIKDAPRAHH